MKLFTLGFIVAQIFVSSLAGATSPTGGRACFFKDGNFKGPWVCVPSGGRIDRLSHYGMNDKISSIDLQGVNRVLVCRNGNFGGSCLVIARDIYRINYEISESWNDEISSIYVY